MSHPNPSASLVSLSTTKDMSTTPHASTTNLIAPAATASPKSSAASHIAPAAPSPTSKVVKDYESAFAALSSSYGWSGLTPTSTANDASYTAGKKEKNKRKWTQGRESTKCGESNARS